MVNSSSASPFNCTSPLYPSAKEVSRFALRVERPEVRVLGEMALKIRVVSCEILEVRIVEGRRSKAVVNNRIYRKTRLLGVITPT